MSAQVPEGRRRGGLFPGPDEDGAVHAAFWAPLLLGALAGLIVGGVTGAVVGLVLAGFVAGIATAVTRAVLARREE